jgi:predicted RNA-binding Zn ribbon-like protein
VNEQAFVAQAEGKPAPMPLLAVQAFANTLDIEDDIDRLASPAAMQEWLEESEMIVPGLVVRPDHAATTRELRDALREGLAANTAGSIDPAATRRLAERAGTLQIGLLADDAGHLGLDLSPAESVAALGSQLLAIVFQSQIDGTWERLKLCENPDCAWAFYDNSRNRSGSWCRMGLCGNRLKNRAYRERQRAG